MKLVDTFTKHRSEPEKSFDTHLKEQHLALGVKIRDRKKVYLDTKYWILLRDCQLGRSDDEAIIELLQLLRQGVATGKLICPISADVFIEILKQTNKPILRSSAELIDALSLGVSILSWKERRRLELLYFARKNLWGESSCYSPNLLVWTKLPYTFGRITLCKTSFPPSEELVIQKAFFDHMWGVTLQDMIDVIGMNVLRDMPRASEFSEKLNKGKFAHAHENKTFEQLFLSEINGALDTMLPDIQEMFSYLYESSMGEIAAKDQIDQTDSCRLFANIIREGFRLNRLTTDLPTVRILATLHAAIRWNSQQRYKPNDFHDIGHAEAALPYHQIFLTERSLAHLLTRKDLGLDKLCGCRVIFEPSQAAEEIRTLAS